MADAFAITLNNAPANAGLDALALVVKAQSRPVAQAAAQVFYEETKLRAPVAKKEKRLPSGRIIWPGALKASIYQVYSIDNSDGERSTYHVSWNHRKAPHGHLVEYGTSRAPAHPFLRPAYDTALAGALAAANAQFAATPLP